MAGPGIPARPAWSELVPTSAITRLPGSTKIHRLLGMGRAKLSFRDKVLSLVWIYLAESELVGDIPSDHVSNKVVSLACLCGQLVKRKVTPGAYAADRTEVVFTRIDPGGEIGSTSAL